MRPRLRGASFAVLFFALAGSAPASAQTLSEALTEAYQTNPQLLAQRALLRATDEQVPQALANWRPMVAFTGLAAFETSASAQPHFSTFYLHPRSSSLNLSVAQPLYRGARTEAQTRQAINTIQATRAQTLAIETMVFQSVAQSYLNVVRDQNLVVVERNNERVLRKLFEETEERFRIGRLTGTEVAQAQSAFAQATGTRIAAEGQLEISRASYTRAVGHPPGRLVLPRERPALPATREEALSLAAHDNFNVISARFTELAARDNIDLVRGLLLPQISVFSDLNRSNVSEKSVGNVSTSAASITANATMPVYEGGAIYSQTRQAEQTVGQRRSEVDAARRAAVQTAAQTWATLQAARTSIDSFRAAVRTAQIAVAGMREELLDGTRTVLDVLVGQQQVFSTQSQLVTAEHDAALAEFNLAAAVGRLIAPELKLPVRLYDMERHYRAVKEKWIGFDGGLAQ